MKPNDNWHHTPWKEYYQRVSVIQEQIVMAYRSKDKKSVMELQRKLVTSQEAQYLAIRRVTANQGAKTAGVDNILWDTPSKRAAARITLKNIVHQPKEYVASPLRRVWISKANSTELRPLGIPTMIDRAVQAVYLMTVDPIVEKQSDPTSYGFRKYRSAHDAITRIRTLLDKKASPTWILDADVTKCFDRISHDFLLNNCLICDKTMLTQWLKCGITDKGTYSETAMGTPHGGIISPMLCNIALNGLEAAAKKALPSTYKVNYKVHLTRYADDFVCTGLTSKLLENNVKPAIAEFLKTRGLEFSEMKTQIVSVDKGFDFLGFTIKREKWNARLNTIGRNGKTPNYVLIVKPRKRSSKAFKDKIREITVRSKSLGKIIKELNPILRGWAEYFRISAHSMRTFSKLSHYVWYKMWSWARKRHQESNHRWLFKRYIIKSGTRKWTFGISENQKLFEITTTTRIAIFLLKLGLNPYIIGNKEYYEKRKQTKVLAPYKRAIYQKFQGKCPLCGESLHNGEPVELHHIKPVKLVGLWTLDNIQPLHRTCHASVTYADKERVIPA